MYYIRILIIILFSSNAVAYAGSGHNHHGQHITGKWSIEKSCRSNIVLTKNKQIVGKEIIGTWDFKGDLLELNIASKKGKEQYVQVLITPISKRKMKILSVQFPFQPWDWPQKKHSIIKKCR